MKKLGNLVSFAFFGISSQVLLIWLLKEAFVVELAFAFLIVAVAFMLYRAYIEEKTEEFSKEEFVKKEMRRWWIRSEPENTFTFAMFGGFILLFSNFAMWNKIELINLWAMGFASVGFMRIIFGEAREVFNRIYIYLDYRVKKSMVKKIPEVKEEHGLRENADEVCY